MTDSGLPSLDATARAIACGERSSREAVEAALARIDAGQPRLNAFSTVLAGPALARADALDAARARGQLAGPLHGVPVAVKDCLDVEGVPNTCGTVSRRDAIARRSAATVQALVDAGAVVVGTTNLHEWAFGATSSSPLRGQVVNPWGEGLVPGGSSGGSAVAVATGMADAALGTDTGGSIRLPASWCGIAGLKVTTGSVSTAGCAPLSWTMDSIGPLARTVADLARPYEALAATGSLVAAPRLPEVERLRVGVLAGSLGPSGLAPGVHRAVSAALASIAGAVARLDEVAVPGLDTVPGAQFAIVCSEGASVHDGPLRAARATYGPDVQALLALGDLVAARDYVHAQRHRQALWEQVELALAGVDVLVMPTTPDQAEPIGADTVVWPDGTPERLLDACIRFLLPWNFLGTPALSQPCGVEDGLPVGLQLVARPGQDRCLLRIGAELEQAFGWSFPAPTEVVS